MSYTRELSRPFKKTKDKLPCAKSKTTRSAAWPRLVGWRCALVRILAFSFHLLSSSRRSMAQVDRLRILERGVLVQARTHGPNIAVLPATCPEFSSDGKRYTTSKNLFLFKLLQSRKNDWMCAAVGVGGKRYCLSWDQVKLCCWRKFRTTPDTIWARPLRQENSNRALPASSESCPLHHDKCFALKSRRIQMRLRADVWILSMLDWSWWESLGLHFGGQYTVTIYDCVAMVRSWRMPSQDFHEAFLQRRSHSSHKLHLLSALITHTILDRGLEPRGIRRELFFGRLALLVKYPLSLPGCTDRRRLYAAGRRDVQCTQSLAWGKIAQPSGLSKVTARKSQHSRNTRGKCER